MRVVLSVTVVLSILACSGAEAPPVPTPPEIAPPSEPVGVAPEPTAEPVAGKVTLSTDRLPEDLRKRITALDREMAGITDVASFAATWRSAQDLRGPLGEAYQTQLGEAMCYDADFTALKLPGMEFGCVAEGTQADVSLPVEPWRVAAARTPGDADDRVIALFDHVYASASVEGFPTWMIQTWDYSGLGTGAVLKILLEADTALAADEVFAPEIGVVHRGALGEIVDASGHSQYCAGQDPMPDDKLQGEAREILAKVELTDEEKKAVEARIGELHGERFTGG